MVKKTYKIKAFNLAYDFKGLESMWQSETTIRHSHLDLQPQGKEKEHWEFWESF